MCDAPPSDHEMQCPQCGATIRARLADQTGPPDWPARLRAAAEVARAQGWSSHGNLLLALAGWMTSSRTPVEAIGRALLGEAGDV